MSTQAPVRERQPRHLQPDPLPSLDELARIANGAHAEAGIALRRSLTHAFHAGEALLQAQRQVEHGSWVKWLADNFHGGLSTARFYMRVAEYRDRLTEDMTMQDAITVLAGLPCVGIRGLATQHPDELRQRAVSLVKQDGWSIRDVAAEVGVAFGTVQRWVDPVAFRKQRDRATKRRRAARQALAAQERERAIRVAVRKAGAALAEAYSMANRYGAVIAQAQQETENDEAKAALDRAAAYHRKMMDEIVSALGVSS